MTRFDMIAAAFPLHAQRIAECTYLCVGGDRVLPRLLTDPPYDFELKHGAGSILQGLFCWEHTSEGHGYWSALCHEARA